MPQKHAAEPVPDIVEQLESQVLAPRMTLPFRQHAFTTEAHVLLQVHAMSAEQQANLLKLLKKLESASTTAQSPSKVTKRTVLMFQ